MLIMPQCSQWWRDTLVSQYTVLLSCYLFLYGNTLFSSCLAWQSHLKDIYIGISNHVILHFILCQEAQSKVGGMWRGDPPPLSHSHLNQCQLHIWIAMNKFVFTTAILFNPVKPERRSWVVFIVIFPRVKCGFRGVHGGSRWKGNKLYITGVVIFLWSNLRTIMNEIGCRHTLGFIHNLSCYNA